ncbi:MAG TPA: hypothetical protein VES02_01545 [Dermatophilaceae bacterium]|nr:hypothetical protein [Dermatophilaceae bacterium]
MSMRWTELRTDGERRGRLLALLTWARARALCVVGSEVTVSLTDPDAARRGVRAGVVGE